MLTACEPAPPARDAPPAPASAQAIDESQVMAFEAGKDLIGRPAPILDFKTLEGRTVRLGVQTRRPVYLKFWATWCSTCRLQMNGFKADFARYGKDIDVVAVNTGVNDDLAEVEAYRRELKLPMPLAIDDGRLAQAFHLKVTPQHIIIGRDGVIRYVGHLEDQRLHRELEAAIADKPLARSSAVAKTAPVDAVLSSVQGGQVRLDGRDPGPPRLVYFLSPWCETYLKPSRPALARECQATREALTRLADSGKARVIGVASGLSTNSDGVRRYLTRTGFKAPIVLDDDGQLFRRFGIRDFPVVVRLDASGRPAGRVDPAELAREGDPK
ncbi:MAG TPA: TlpA disulfide reductase family protein [Caulobacter sp.]|nr:TlpA disulfide reductase family protein [Caulobacter sp.]